MVVLDSLPTLRQIDRGISLRLRQRRLLLGFTQGAVAHAMGVSFQQIQKYETGANRVSSARLFELSCVLNVPIAYFYRRVRVGEDPPKRLPKELMRRSETLSLIRNYYLLDEKVRRAIASMCRSLAPNGRTEKQGEEQGKEQSKEQRRRD